MKVINKWTEQRDMFILAGTLTVGISIVFLLIRGTGGDAFRKAGRIGLFFAALTLICFFLAWCCDYLSTRKPMVRAFPWKYARLKQKTVKKLQALKDEGKLTMNKIQKSKGVFLVMAIKLGVDKEQARHDFEQEIRRKVQHVDH